MESVDLDMGEIFEEGEEDFPSVNPLPDLPQDDEAGEGVGFPEDGEGKYWLWNSEGDIWETFTIYEVHIYFGNTGYLEIIE